MKMTGVLLLLLAVLAVAWTVHLARQDNPPGGGEQADNPSELLLSNLLTQSLAGEVAPDREVIVSYVELPPNTTMDRHWHPGEEFHYYIDGQVTIDFGDGEKISGNPGQVGHVPYKKLHTAITAEDAARFVVFRIHETGKPVRYLEDGSAADR